MHHAAPVSPVSPLPPVPTRFLLHIREVRSATFEYRRRLCHAPVTFCPGAACRPHPPTPIPPPTLTPATHPLPTKFIPPSTLCSLITQAGHHHTRDGCPRVCIGQVTPPECPSRPVFIPTLSRTLNRQPISTPPPSAPPIHRQGTITPAMVAREFATGKAFVHEHTDVYGRPVIVINAQKHVTG